MKKEEGHITKVTREVLYMGTGIPLLSHVGNDASMPFCALVMAGKEVWCVMADAMTDARADVMVMPMSDTCCNGGGDVMMRPQGGGGVDHPNKVQ